MEDSDSDLNLDLGNPIDYTELLKQQLYSDLEKDLKRDLKTYNGKGKDSTYDIVNIPHIKKFKRDAQCNFFNICTVEELVCFLFSTRQAIEGLYGAYARSFNVANSGRSFFYTFSFPGIEGRAIYSAKKMQQLDCEGERTSVCHLCKSLTCDIDNMARLLFKLNKTITGLYGAVVRATNLRDTARTFYYTFNSPFAGCIPMKGGNRISFNRDRLLQISCACERKNPL